MTEVPTAQHAKAYLIKLAMRLLAGTALVIMGAILSRQIYHWFDADRRQSDWDNAVLPVSSDARAECQRFHDQLARRIAASDAQNDIARRAECVES